MQHFLKRLFDFLIPESGRLAGLIAIVLVVTVPDVITFARTAQPPDFVAIKGAAVATDELKCYNKVVTTLANKIY